MNYKNTKVMGNFVMVEPIESTQKTKGGLVLSEADRKEIGVEKGRIISVGPLCHQEFNEGDIAIYNASNVDGVEVDGDIFKVLAEHFIILIQNGD